MFLSSPSDLSQGPQWTPPAIQEINIDDYDAATRRYNENDSAFGQFSDRRALEGTNEIPESGGSTSSRSDSSESEPTVKLRLTSHRNFSNRRSFMSKPVHPLSYPAQNASGEAFESSVAGFSEFEPASLQRDAHRWSSASSSIDFTDVSEQFESENCGRPCPRSDGFRCGLCERYLSQRSPWSTRRIVRSGDMPVAGVLPCLHVFHAECLEQTTPKTRKNDPPCPTCVKHEEGQSQEPQPNTKLRNTFPRLRPLCDDGPSTSCVEGALHAAPRNTMLLLNRNRLKKNLSLRGNPTKEFPGRLRKHASCNSKTVAAKPLEPGVVGCSKTSSASPSVNR